MVTSELSEVGVWPEIIPVVCSRVPGPTLPGCAGLSAGPHGHTHTLVTLAGELHTVTTVAGAELSCDCGVVLGH